MSKLLLGFTLAVLVLVGLLWVGQSGRRQAPPPPTKTVRALSESPDISALDLCDGVPEEITDPYWWPQECARRGFWSDSPECREHIEAVRADMLMIELQNMPYDCF